MGRRFTDAVAKRLEPVPGKALHRYPSDVQNLYLAVSDKGTKSWQYRFTLHGRESIHTLKPGRFPAVSVADAEAKAAALARMVAEGRNPNEERRQARASAKAAAAETFGAVKAAWIVDESRRKKWSADYREQVEATLANHLPHLDRRQITGVVARITAPMLDTVEASAPYMREKVERHLNAILDFAVEKGLLERNPLPARRRRSKVERKHFPAITAAGDLGELLRAARNSDVARGVMRAHLLCAFTAQRIAEVVGATWDEFDVDAATWSIPRARMKRKDAQRGPHLVPLPPVLLAALRAWHDADGPTAVYVCPAPRDAKASIVAEAVEKFYRRIGYAGRHSPHSWRSAFSTIAREAGKDGDLVERQLDHKVGDNAQAPYDRASRLEDRRTLMAWYESVLLGARDKPV